MKLLQANPPLVYRAIMAYIQVNQWERAMDLAQNRNSYIEVVLWHRKQYLNGLQRNETSTNFVNLFEKFGNVNISVVKKLVQRGENEENTAAHNKNPHQL